MKYATEFRDPKAAKALLALIDEKARALGATRAHPVSIMEICGGHTHSIFRYGLDKLVHEGIEFVHGPGCPVCVLPRARVDEAIQIAERSGVIFTTFGDAMRVPGARMCACFTACSMPWNWPAGTPTRRWSFLVSGSKPRRHRPPLPFSRPRARG